MANYNTYIGTRESLKFPVMCDGYVSLEYDDNIATTAYGIWDLDDSFTFQSIITPYDVNGNSKSTVLTSEKTMPADAVVGSQGKLYLPFTNRYSHKMNIFYSTNFEIFLENTTNTNYNQPAEYRIGMRVKLTNDDTLYTNKIIVAKENHSDMRNINDMYSGTQKIRRYVETLTYNGAGSAVTGAALSLTLNSNGDNFVVHMPLYDSNNKYIGDVITIEADPSNAVLNIGGGDADYVGATWNTTTKKLYTNPLKEPLYVLGTNHVACSFNNGTGEMNIFIDGSLIGSKFHIDKETLNVDFNMDGSSIYLGQNPLATTPRYTQFMGEMHEVCITKNLLSSFPSIYSLIPQRKNLLLYLTFDGGEVVG